MSLLLLPEPSACRSATLLAPRRRTAGQVLRRWAAWGAMAWLAGPALLLAQTPAPDSADAPATSDLDAALFYQLLLGELELRQNDPGSAYSLMLDAAKRTGRPELYRRAVEMALQGRAGNAALAAARAWAQVAPDSEEPHRFELQILLALNRPADIAAPLRQLIRLTPVERRNDVISAIPQTLHRTSDKAATLQAVRKALAPALADDTTAVAAWVALGRMQVTAQDWAGALHAADQALTCQPDSPLAAALSLELLQREQPGAQALFQRFLQNPATATSEARVPLHLAYVRVLLDQRHWADADAALQTLQASAPQHPEVWLLQGTLHAQQRHYSTAETALKRYLAQTASADGDEVVNGRIQAHLQLAQMAEQQGNYTTANAWLDRIDRPEQLLPVQVRRAQILAKQGRLDQARQLLRDLPTRSDTDLRRHRMAEAQLLRDHGQAQAAYEIYSDLSARFPQDPDLAYERAMAAEKAGHFDEMERQLRDLIAEHPDQHHAFNALGYALADRNQRLGEAKTLIQQALRHAPTDPFIIDSLGWVEFRLGNSAEALRLLTDAFRRRPDPEIAAHLGEVHWSLQQTDQAKAIWREGLALDPDNATLRQTLQRLQVQP